MLAFILAEAGFVRSSDGFGGRIVEIGRWVLAAGLKWRRWCDYSGRAGGNDGACLADAATHKSVDFNLLIILQSTDGMIIEA
ncbi:MAG: hypothetical protein B7Z67_07805 [Acidiphilium sp. 21-60-14]|nr:MAG: hypothetical protein B7Z67_07805 [Acidiphilium sp. 21-60-14]OYV90318.1 MAG: hypothetical protein B7Z57_09090 [Acidiphilium sp. 37-60-79]OZB38033.1 MAG: hypothetical protein B7X48_14680 [Acidiphilium sp. 34-60-192]